LRIISWEEHGHPKHSIWNKGQIEENKRLNEALTQEQEKNRALQNAAGTRRPAQGEMSRSQKEEEEGGREEGNYRGLGPKIQICCRS